MNGTRKYSKKDKKTDEPPVKSINKYKEIMLLAATCSICETPEVRRRLMCSRLC